MLNLSIMIEGQPPILVLLICTITSVKAKLCLTHDRRLKTIEIFPILPVVFRAISQKKKRIKHLLKEKTYKKDKAKVWKCS